MVVKFFKGLVEMFQHLIIIFFSFYYFFLYKMHALYIRGRRGIRYQLEIGLPQQNGVIFCMVGLSHRYIQCIGCVQKKYEIFLTFS